MATKENMKIVACPSSDSKLCHELDCEKCSEQPAEHRNDINDDTEIFSDVDTYAQQTSLCSFCNKVPVVAYCQTCKSPLCTLCCADHIQQEQLYKKHIIINYEHKITAQDNRSSRNDGYVQIQEADQFNRNNINVLHDHNHLVTSRNSDLNIPQSSAHGVFKFSTIRKKVKRSMSDTFVKKPSKRYLSSNYHIKHIQSPYRIKTNGDQMGRMFRIAFSKTGAWAVADYSNHCVHVCDANNELVQILGKGNNQFNHPVGTTFDSEGCLYVSDGNHRVQKFDANFEYLLQFGGKGEKDGQLDQPMSIAAYNDKVYVADSANSRIAVFNTNGKFCCNIVGGCLRGPYDVAINKINEQLLVTDSGCCIRMYSLEGEYINRFSGFGADRGQLNHPASLAIDSNGFVFVADTYNHRVCIFNSAGIFVRSFGSFGDNIGQFKYPQGIAFSPIGALYVSDSKNQRVVIFPTKFKPGLK